MNWPFGVDEETLEAGVRIGGGDAFGFLEFLHIGGGDKVGVDGGIVVFVAELTS